jgi:hypothetical protein
VGPPLYVVVFNVSSIYKWSLLHFQFSLDHLNMMYPGKTLNKEFAILIME